jgi:hypothetical protein
MVTKIIGVRKLCYEILKIDKDELFSLAASAESHYRPYIQVKIRKDGPEKKRLIEPPEKYGYLWVMQKRINRRILQPEIEKLPKNIMGGRKTYSVTDNAKLHSRSKALMKYDIENFFPSIRYEHVYRIFRYDLGFCEPAANLLTLLTTYEKHVPQGAPTSTSIAIFATRKMCEKLDAYCAKNGLHWSIWVDDITVSGDKEILQKHKNAINSIVKSMPFKISREKETGIIVVGSNRGNNRKKLMSTTGITLQGNGRLSIGKRKKTIKKQALRAKQFSQSLFGKLQFLKMVDSKYGSKLYQNYKNKFNK